MRNPSRVARIPAFICPQSFAGSKPESALVCAAGGWTGGRRVASQINDTGGRGGRRGGTPLTGGENFRMNLWLFNTAPPTNGADQEVVISRFAFVPSPLPAATFTNAEISAVAGLRLCSAAESALTYRIQVSSNLAAWSEAGEVIATTNGIEYTETTNSSGDRRFFRAVTPEQ